MSSPAPVIQVANLSKHFGSVKAVDSVSFAVAKGEVVGFVGPNGAGKTTTISTLLGFLRATSGSVKIRDIEVRPETAHNTHHNVGYAAGDMAFFDNLTGGQYLAFLAKRYGSYARQDELIQRLRPTLGKRLKQLSRGNKQKIALIGAFQHEPELAILDEPTTGLDPLMQEVFLQMIREEKKRGATIFMSSHILNEVTMVCDRVLFMKRGKIITDQPVEELERTAGKIITITTNATDVKQMSEHLLEGATLLSKTKNSLKLRFDGDIRLFVSWLDDRPILDLTITDRNLDAIFHDLYKEGDES